MITPRTNLGRNTRRRKEKQAVDKIIAVSAEIGRFWKQSHGWAPKEAADLLSAARLDRQVSFTHTLMSYLSPFASEEAEARQILGYATLRSLCEGVLKLFFAVYLKDYLKQAKTATTSAKAITLPPAISFDRLITLYSQKVSSRYRPYLRRIQERGNGIHHFAERSMGTQSDLIKDIVKFKDFLLYVNSRLPYPFEEFHPNYV